MIHAIQITAAGQTYVARFPAEKTGDARMLFALLANRGEISMAGFFDANQQLRQIEDRHVNEIEAIKARLVRQGFFLQINANSEGWQVSLWHSLPGVHRQPQGRAETLRDALVAAEADLGEMLEAKKAKV